MKKNENWKQERQEQMKSIIADLEDGVKSVFTSEHYVEYLRVLSKFHAYSYSNSVLIMRQCPTATYVASYPAWKKDFNRQVKKGEKGIKILVPTPKKVKFETEVENDDGTVSVEETVKKVMYFKTGNVFDISQTEGDPLPQLVSKLDGDGEWLDALLEKLISTAAVPVGYDSNLGEDDANGYYRISDCDIFLKPSMSALQTLKTLFHEYSHYLQETAYAKEIESCGHEAKEVIAESCAFCVFEMLKNETGMETFDSSDYSFGYIAGWGSRDLKELKATLNLILKISNQIFDWVSDITHEVITGPNEEEH